MFNFARLEQFIQMSGDGFTHARQLLKIAVVPQVFNFAAGMFDGICCPLIRHDSESVVSARQFYCGSNGSQQLGNLQIGHVAAGVHHMSSIPSFNILKGVAFLT
ncbi:MAG: hypothetical protein UY06_C0040G0007 [Candidatus Amesbacteria bacterium GW2011_GWA2_47_70]|nr:MAG: hypothetical protein UY06_C0040G0007 [Candidatus Amesbacteria bacterium GW2011_GWA2_47_70]